ncbi:glycosyltransferase family 4 protein [Xylaria longipes]|nr:glycosyltransferase family 4 protein [Xylaria longipes]
MSSQDRRAGFFASASRTKHHWSPLTEHHSQFAPSHTPLFISIAYTVTENEMLVSMAFHDHTYLIDFTIEHLPLSKSVRSKQDLIVEFIVAATRQYEHENNAKFVGAAVPRRLVELSPKLCSRLWLDLDRNVDEQADSMARKCGWQRFFGPSLTPILQVGFRGAVMSDSAFRANLVTLEDHRELCGEATWTTMMKYAMMLKTNKTRIAFFSSTPQGGGVAREYKNIKFAKDVITAIPKPRPGVFRSTKDMHNILQGVIKPGKRLTKDEQDVITDWITHNAQTYWLSPGGPLCAVEEGGAHIIVVDNPQMPTLIPLIKNLTPDRPAWEFLWKAIRRSDLFISHPIPEFVPKEIPREMVAYMPATTDWLDGLNKPLSKWATGYYLNLYNRECISHQMTSFLYPERGYIVQVARFDPAKGIPTVLDAYAEFRKRAHEAGISKLYIPQLIIAGNSSIDDPDAGIVFDEALNQIEEKYPELFADISIMRLQANEQLLNALISSACVVLQLLTREGFEVKVSEALHAGRPVIPIQVKDKENVFLVDPEDYEAVAQHLVEICGNHHQWEKMSFAAATGVSDEVGTVGNALCWYYLAAKLTGGDKRLAGNRRWINDLARTEAGYPYKPGENRLLRRFTEEKQQGVVS